MVIKIDKMGAAEFKAKCLRVMENVATTQRPVVVTKKGRPLVQVVPINDEAPDVFGALAGEIEVLGDIVAPVLPASAWKTEKTEKSEKSER